MYICIHIYTYIHNAAIWPCYTRKAESLLALVPDKAAREHAVQCQGPTEPRLREFLVCRKMTCRTMIMHTARE